MFMKALINIDEQGCVCAFVPILELAVEIQSEKVFLAVLIQMIAVILCAVWKK